MTCSFREETMPDSARAIRDLVREAAGPLGGKRDFVLVEVGAPLAHPAFLLRALPGEDGFVWMPEGGPSLSGAGVVCAIDAAGDARLDEIRARSAAIWKSSDWVAGEGRAPRVPLLFGGSSFAPGKRRHAPWETFPDASFVLPRWTYGTDGKTAWIRLALRGEEDRARLDELLAELERLLASSGWKPEREIGARETNRREMGRDDWSALVEGIRTGIQEGRFAKVVAASCTILDFDSPPDPFAVFDRLDRSYGDCHRFLLRRAGAVFLGATPERLVRKEGREIRAEALAGSIDAAEIEAEKSARTIALLESRKDLGEHDLVVDAMRRKLASLCSELRVPARPQIRELRNVLHLHTPMSGILAHDTHILDLASALHPTPSVGGVPTADALRWIAEHEPVPRGWYAGPVGWFDANGDGDLAVAIRSGVLLGTRAWVYAGAGIVGDSDPEKEYEETKSKRKPVLRALGVAD